MSNETLVEALRELFVKWLESRSPFRTTVEVEAAWEGWKANTAIAAMLAAEVTEPVAWSCQNTINDDDGCPIGMDEPRVHWGSGCPDDDGGWSPLYTHPQPAQAAEPVAEVVREIERPGVIHEYAALNVSLPVGTKLYTHPQPAQDAKDAARFRWLRDSADSYTWDYLGGIGADRVDAAIDAATAKESGR